MALTLAKIDTRPEDVFGAHKARIVSVTFDSSYATGGESLTPAMLGLSSIALVLVSVDANADLPFTVQYDYTAQKLQVFGVQQDADASVTDPLDEEDSTSDLSTLVVRLLVLGN